MCGPSHPRGTGGPPSSMRAPLATSQRSLNVIAAMRSIVLLIAGPGSRPANRKGPLSSCLRMYRLAARSIATTSPRRVHPSQQGAPDGASAGPSLPDFACFGRNTNVAGSQVMISVRHLQNGTTAGEGRFQPFARPWQAPCDAVFVSHPSPDA